MDYKSEWTKCTYRNINKLNIFISKSKNLFCKCCRSLIKYNLILNNLCLILNTVSLKNIVYQSLLEITTIQGQLSNSNLTNKTQKNFSSKFRDINDKIKTGLNFKPSRYSIPNFKLSWEKILIKELNRLMSNLDKIDLTQDKCLEKQAIKISHIFSYLKNRLPLILGNSRFYVIIRLSIEKITYLRAESQILPCKYRNKLKRTFRNYLQAIDNWKKMRYLHIWLTKQIPILIEHQRLIVEYLFPKVYL